MGTVHYVFMGFHTCGLVFLLPPAIRSELVGWTTTIAGMGSMVMVAAYLVVVHPLIQNEIRDFAA